LGISIIVLLVVVGPLATIWAANTLFPALAIPYALETWFAVILLGAFFRTNVSIKK
jgi:urea transporter